MKKTNSLENSSFKIDVEHDDDNEVNKKININSMQNEKILCDHCERTANNGIRCLGICVADSDY